MSKSLYLIATIYPALEHIEYLKKEFATLVAESYKEAGCEMYDLVSGEGEEVWEP
jgi:quinol monooxygenase YgiN